MRETSKLTAIRRKLGYGEHFFVGDGIDIGCGDDPLDPKAFARIRSVFPFDKDDGDASTCSGLSDGRFDFVYSSHCLEHLEHPAMALAHWLRICKPGGHLIVAVPHEIYYEKGLWPSRFNPDHKHSFRLEPATVLPRSIHVPGMLVAVADRAEVLRCELVLEQFDFAAFYRDQTKDDAICQIEFVLRKNPC